MTSSENWDKRDVVLAGLLADVRLVRSSTSVELSSINPIFSAFKALIILPISLDFSSSEVVLIFSLTMVRKNDSANSNTENLTEDSLNLSLYSVKQSRILFTYSNHVWLYPSHFWISKSALS